MIIQEVDAAAPPVAALIDAHLRHSQTHCPDTSMHSFGLARIAETGTTLFGALDGETLLGVAGLRERSGADGPYGEVKSMHTIPAARGTGVGAALLDAVIREAERRSYGRLMLETGSDAEYAPARRLYERAGFAPCGPFADYRDDPLSVFMQRALTRPAA